MHHKHSHCSETWQHVTHMSSWCWDPWCWERNNKCPCVIYLIPFCWKSAKNSFPCFPGHIIVMLSSWSLHHWVTIKKTKTIVLYETVLTTNNSQLCLQHFFFFSFRYDSQKSFGFRFFWEPHITIEGPLRTLWCPISTKSVPRAKNGYRDCISTSKKEVQHGLGIVRSPTMSFIPPFTVLCPKKSIH